MFQNSIVQYFKSCVKDFVVSLKSRSAEELNSYFGNHYCYK